MERREVYLDNNATTKPDERVIKYIAEVMENYYAVASSQFSHTPGIMAKEIVDNARKIIASSINAEVEEIVFTSGATESNNLAIKGVAFANLEGKRKKILVSPIEHFSVLHTANFLKRFGFIVETLKVDGEGFLDLEDLKKKVDENTLLVSVMLANHEVGTIQPIKDIAEIVHSKGAIFHTDAAVGYMQIPINVKEMGIDLLSITAHKIYGPKGVGALFVKNGIKIEKIIHGGYQENDLRAGTENVFGIAGFGKAVEIYSQEDTKKMQELRDYLYKRIMEEIDGVVINGPKDFSKRLPNNLNVSFDYIEGESVVLHMDMRGVAVITGSACFSRSLQASHVMLAMGFTHERAHGSIRFGTSKYLTMEDIEYTVFHLKEVVKRLREISPLVPKK